MTNVRPGPDTCVDPNLYLCVLRRICSDVCVRGMRHIAVMGQGDDAPRARQLAEIHFLSNPSALRILTRYTQRRCTYYRNPRKVVILPLISLADSTIVLRVPRRPEAVQRRRRWRGVLPAGRRVQMAATWQRDCGNATSLTRTLTVPGEGDQSSGQASLLGSWRGRYEEEDDEGGGRGELQIHGCPTCIPRLQFTPA